jgi:hypothetical protein
MINPLAPPAAGERVFVERDDWRNRNLFEWHRDSVRVSARLFERGCEGSGNNFRAGIKGKT